MARKKEDMELRYYDIPQGSGVFALLGEEWIREYGLGISKLHFHNLMEIGYCRYGEGKLILDEREVLYSRGMITVIPANYPHTTNSRTGEKSYWEYIYFEPETILSDCFSNDIERQTELLTYVNKTALVFNENDQPDFSSIIFGIMEEMRSKGTYYEHIVRGLAQAMVMSIARLQGGAEYKTDVHRKQGIIQLSGALDFIRDHYKENIKIVQLADSCGLSETHFRRLFDSYMNMTPAEYVNLVRVQQACKLLRKTTNSMDEVAAECGFSSTVTFNRNFRHFTGTTPYQWKKSPQNFESKLLQFKVTAERGWE